MKNKISKKTILYITSVLLLLLLFSSCANKENVHECLHGPTFGFLGGLWHGVIAPFDLIGMLFRDDVSVYAVNNNGAWYAFGFLIGSGGWGFFGSKGAKRRRRD